MSHGSRASFATCATGAGMETAEGIGMGSCPKSHRCHLWDVRLGPPTLRIMPIMGPPIMGPIIPIMGPMGLALASPDLDS